MTAKKKRPRTRPASYTTLPGGVKLTFVGYLPSKECPSCRRVWPAAEYVKSLNSRRRLKFDARCLQCDPPEDFPRDLRGVRPTSTYKVGGRVVGWQERNRSGLFGPMLSLESMALRKTEDGVWRPQPKLDRRSKQQQLEQPRVKKTYRAVGDHRRTFSDSEVDDAILAQKGLCKACRKPFTRSDPAVGDHNLPYADGWATDPPNCTALHRSCNGKKGRRSLAQYQHDQRLRTAMPLFSSEQP